jgi:hypothetical protein
VPATLGTKRSVAAMRGLQKCGARAISGCSSSARSSSTRVSSTGASERTISSSRAKRRLASVGAGCGRWPDSVMTWLANRSRSVEGLLVTNSLEPFLPHERRAHRKGRSA